MFIVSIQIEHVTDESNIHDWSKLDRDAVQMSKAFYHTPSMFGAFDFDDVADETQATQKQKRTRRKVELGVEKRPVAVSQPETSERRSTKVEQVFHIIKEVSRMDCDAFQ